MGEGRAGGSGRGCCSLGLAAVGRAGRSPRTRTGTRRFEITASRYAFDPARIEVRQGDVVELVLRSADTDHGLAIKAYGREGRDPEGRREPWGSRSWPAGRGPSPIECSEYCGSGHKRMKGELVVAERAQ